MGLPASRFLQALRLAGEAKAEAARGRMLEGAFIGWQVAGSFAGEKIGSFQRYAKNLGVLPHTPAPVMTPEEAAVARERAEAEAARVVQAFSKKGGEA